MEFKIEDILKNIIPGMLFMIGILLFYFNDYTYAEFNKFISSDIKEYSEILLVFILAGSYIAGYLVDSLSSVLEFYCIYGIFGSPALRLLNGKGNRIKLIISDLILDNLNSKCYSTNNPIKFTKKFFENKKIARDLFKHANILKDSNPNEEVFKRIREYYNSYIFSRNLFFSFLFTFAIIIIFNSSFLNISRLVILFILLIILFLRRRDRSYYYSRQILLASKF